MLGGIREFLHCMKYVPAGQAHKCIPALWGELPPGVPPLPKPEEEREKRPSPWKWFIAGVIVGWLLKR